MQIQTARATLRTAMAAALVIAITAATLTGCTGEAMPPPRMTPEAINGEELASEYNFNFSRAHKEYKDKWVTVTAGPVQRVRYGNYAYISYGDRKLLMVFKRDEDAEAIEPDEHVTAICRVKGWRGGATRLAHCHWP